MLWILVVVLLALGAGWYFWTNSSPAPIGTAVSNAAVSMQTNSSASATSTASGKQASSMSAVVIYNGSTFSPASVTIAKGGTVTWMDTTGTMWIASDPSSDNSGYDGTTMAAHCAQGYGGAAPFDACIPGTSFTFTFDTAGTWNYHDHLNSAAEGTVIVQ